MRVDYIELLGVKYPVCFSLSAAKEIGEAFGGLDKLNSSLKDNDISSMAHAVDVVLSSIMKAGRIYDQLRGVELPPKLECKASDLIDVNDTNMIKKIFSVLSKDTEREVEAESKNVEATQGN